jgi:nitrite reductase (NADH) large subunit
MKDIKESVKIETSHNEPMNKNQQNKSLAFQCVICGYIHMGATPPKSCPICGATDDEFEVYEQTMAMEEEKATQFRCLNCEYIHQGEEAPSLCPVCGLDSEHFEKVQQTAISDYVEPLEHIVIIGGGIAGVSAVETIREYMDTVKITFISGEERLPYYRLNLTRLLGAQIGEEELCIHPQYWYDDQRIQVFKKKIVTDISPSKKEITLNDHTHIHYDKLICTLGAHPFIPPIEGANLPHVISIRSIEDVHSLLEDVTKGQSVLVMGGGVLGIETAGALASKGYKVTIAEGSKWLMPRQLNEEAAAYVDKNLRKLGIDIVYNFITTQISTVVVASDGRQLEADSVILATGVRPNTYLARKAELEVNQGLVVDNYMQTSDEHIYAAGDITEHYGVVYGLWNIAKYQGRIAALNVLGKKVPFGGVPRSNALKVLDIDLFSIGNFTLVDASYTALSKESEDHYLLFVFKDQIIVGSIAIGYKHLTHKIKARIEAKQQFTSTQLNTIDSVLEVILNGGKA